MTNKKKLSITIFNFSSLLLMYNTEVNPIAPTVPDTIRKLSPKSGKKTKFLYAVSSSERTKTSKEKSVKYVSADSMAYDYNFKANHDDPSPKIYKGDKYSKEKSDKYHGENYVNYGITSKPKSDELKHSVHSNYSKQSKNSSSNTSTHSSSNASKHSSSDTSKHSSSSNSRHSGSNNSRHSSSNNSRHSSSNNSRHSSSNSRKDMDDDYYDIPTSKPTYSNKEPSSRENDSPISGTDTSTPTRRVPDPDRPTSTPTHIVSDTDRPTSTSTPTIIIFGPNRPTSTPSHMVYEPDRPTSTSTPSHIVYEPEFLTSTSTPTIIIFEPNRPTLTPTYLVSDPDLSTSPSVTITEAPVVIETISQESQRIINPTVPEAPVKAPQPVPPYWFDYNPNSPYGPLYWDEIQIDSNSNTLLQPYFESMNNECDGKKQSPLNLEENYECMDDHRVSTKRGKDDFESLEFVILPSSLRVNLHHLADGPKADFSNLTPLIPAVFVDIKVGSEHYMAGKQYSGEFQIAHHDDYYHELVIISIFMDDAEDKEHEQLEQFLLKWEQESAIQHNKCFGSDHSTDYRPLADFEMEQIWGSNKSSSDSNFDLYRFLTTGWYYGYKGSITMPPCREDVHWRILDVPMQISKDQIKRMKDLQINSLDSNCQKNSASYYNQVNRPLQKNNNQNVWRCTEKDWSLKDNDPIYWFESWPDEYHAWPSQ